MSTHQCGSIVRRVSSAIVLVLAILASPALAQKADRPAMKVGDAWQFAAYYTPPPPSKPNLNWVITAVTPTGITGTENGAPLKLTPDLNMITSPRSDNSDLKLLSFPLEVGKKWTFANDFLQKDVSYKGRSDMDVAVIGYEKVRVPAGEFDAFKLEAKGKSGVGGAANPGSTTVARTYWYAPAARAIVKHESRNPNRGIETIELVSFKLQP